MASQKQQKKLDDRATMAPGGARGISGQAQQHPSEGKSRGKAGRINKQEKGEHEVKGGGDQSSGTRGHIGEEIDVDESTG